MKKIISIIVFGVLLYFPFIGYANMCGVTVNADDIDDGSSIRSIIDDTLYNNSSGGCVINSSNDNYFVKDENGDHLQQYIGFETEEGEPIDGTWVKHIKLKQDSGPLHLLPTKSLLIGNQSNDAVTDAASVLDYSEAIGHYPQQGGEVKDYGFVIIDASAKEGMLPFECKEGSSSVYLRNLILVAKGVTQEDIMAEPCVFNGGDLHFCMGELLKDGDNFDPAIDGKDTWCKEEEEDPCPEGYETFYKDYDNDGYTPHQRMKGKLVGSLPGKLFEGEIGPGANATKITICTGSLRYPYYEAAQKWKTADELSDVGFMMSAGFNDCDDGEATVHPYATEISDGLDNDCDGEIDEGFDADGDGYSVYAGDCDDNDAAINPGAVEICDGIDNDCDGVVPDDELDADGDGYSICQGDCDDNNAAVSPVATEICDEIDNNCDGAVDEEDDCITDPVDVDVDGDGYTVADGDCNDNDATINFDADDICGDGIDQDCSGEDLVCEIEDICPDSRDGVCADPGITKVDPNDFTADAGGCGCDLSANRTASANDLSVMLSALIVFVLFVVLRRKAVRVMGDE